MYKVHPDFKPHVPVTAAQLKEIAARPVLDTGGVGGAVIIESFALIKSRGMWFLRVRGGGGAEGIAPCSGWARDFWPILKERLLPGMVGRDARDLERVLDEIFVRDLNYKMQGLAWWCCVAWAEAAVLDMLGKAAGVSVTELIGGRRRDSLELYVASGNRHTTPEEEVAVLDEKLAAMGGAKAIKFKLGGRMSNNADSLAGRTEGILRLARRHFGDGMVIHADGNGSFDAAKGIEVGRLAEEAGVYFYEEPCPFDDLWDTKAVADALDAPVAFGEQETSLRRFAWLIEHDAAQVLQPDIQYTGGFIRCIKVARMAEAAGKPVTPHVSGGWPAYNMLLFCSVIPNVGHYHEFKGYHGAEDCAEIAVKDGRVTIPSGVGLGLDLRFVNESGEVVFTVTSLPSHKDNS